MKNQSAALCQISREMVERSRDAIERSYRILSNCPIEAAPPPRRSIVTPLNLEGLQGGQLR